MSAAIANRAKSAKPAKPPALTDRIVKLQVNTTGAWRNVMDFNVQDEDVLHLAASLFALDKDRERLRLRIIAPGDTAPLMDWTHQRGWLEWRAA